MNCSDFQDLIEDYHDGTLDEEIAASVQLHLGNCPQCAETLVMMQNEEKLYQSYRETLERELVVKPEMWSHVRARIETEGVLPPEARTLPSRGVQLARWLSFLGGPHWARQLAFAALLVVFSVAGTLLVVRNRADVTSSVRIQQVPAPAPGSTPTQAHPAELRTAADDLTREGSLEAAVRAIQRAERDYLEAIHLLTDVVDRRKPSLDPKLVRELNSNLKAIDANIEATRKAYYAHPSDPYLAQYMLTAYGKKVELLQELASS